MKYSYKTAGTCSREIIVDIEGDIVKSIKFIGGCSGNTQGIEKLVKNMKIDDVINKLKGIDCGGRGTSCPDQLSKALENAKEQILTTV